jgi:RNA polymerase sigma-70 factor (ECF subfamily)
METGMSVEHDQAGDGVLVGWFQDGDERALETLLKRYEAPLYQFLIGILRDPHQAEDALQETWCRALEHLGSVDGGHLRGWLFTVAYHQAMLIKRRQKTRAAAPAERLPLADPHAGPESALERQEDIARLKELIDRLPLQQREVILQRIYEGKRFREIADTLACPLNTALARMHEGIKKLKVLWREST